MENQLASLRRGSHGHQPGVSRDGADVDGERGVGGCRQRAHSAYDPGGDGVLRVRAAARGGMVVYWFFLFLFPLRFHIHSHRLISFSDE